MSSGEASHPEATFRNRLWNDNVRTRAIHSGPTKRCDFCRRVFPADADFKRVPQKPLKSWDIRYVLWCTDCVELYASELEEQ